MAWQKGMFKLSRECLRNQKQTLLVYSIRLHTFYFSIENIPHTTTEKNPAELFLKRAPSIKLTLVKPSLKLSVEYRQAKSKFYKDGVNHKMLSFDLYQSVRVRHLRGGKVKWIPGTIVEVKGPQTYLVRTPGNNRRYVHANHLRHDDSKRQNANPEMDIENPNQDTRFSPSAIRFPSVPHTSMVPDIKPDPSPSVITSPSKASSNIPIDSILQNFDELTQFLRQQKPNLVQNFLVLEILVIKTRSGRVVRPPKFLNL
ncbi:hypothetical protein BSL78_19462 [Apostichopus japonicus]|uniref:Uncharacterized protein n=1 Tax=Stichopus japonicus TaxID=307972 RepID=A0A2G8K6R7_STIJA|nr:hypothetical protein BSL78_19462 [Apostichopus japonicus]